MGKICIVCGKDIVKPKSGRTSNKFCSSKCSQRDYRDKNKDIINRKTREERRVEAEEKWNSNADIFCAFCGKRIEYSTTPRFKYCSKECARVGNYMLPDAKSKRKLYRDVYVSDNKDKINKQRRESGYTRSPYRKRLNRVKSSYGLSEEEYVSMMDKQKGCCGICETSLDFINVDHCHTSGNVRELLCSNCNHGLGHFKDDTEIMRKAIDYIKRHQGE